MKNNERNDIEKLILNGSFIKESQILNTFSDKDINYFLYFSLKNKKYQSFDFFLNSWKCYYFNNNKNIISLLVDDMFNTEIIILSKIRNDIIIEDKYLDFYQEKINNISIPQKYFNGALGVWEDLISFKRKENLFNSLSKKLNNNKLNKGVKI